MCLPKSGSGRVKSIPKFKSEGNLIFTERYKLEENSTGHLVQLPSQGRINKHQVAQECDRTSPESRQGWKLHNIPGQAPLVL